MVYLWNLSLHFLKEDLSQGTIYVSLFIVLLESSNIIRQARFKLRYLEKLPDLEKLSKIAANLNHKHHQILRNAKELRYVVVERCH